VFREVTSSSRALTSAKNAPVVKFWAAVGAVLFLFEAFVWLRWITGPNFKSIDPGPDRIPAFDMQLVIGLQIVAVVGSLLCLWFWVVHPWIKNRRLTTDGMIALCVTLTCFYDPAMNYTSTTLLYNANFVNFGSWTAGSWPGWTSPNGNLLPEPIFVTPGGYLLGVYGQVVFILWLLRKYSLRRPEIGILTLIGIIMIGITCIDILAELLLIRTGEYMYPGGIRALTVFAGKWYQFPLTEAFFFGGLALSAAAVLQFFKNDRGQTLVERGLDQLKVGTSGKQWIKFLALFGFVHLAFLMLYLLPNMWLSTHSDAYPSEYKDGGPLPSYFINNMCVYGDHHDQCPGPGVSIPRPLNNPL
jgi:Spirocyclase AveC-like